MESRNIKTERELRLCKVDGEIGYFHTWEQFYNVVDLSRPLDGGYYGGMVGGVYGIVEFEDRVEHVTPTSITFIDEKNSMLHAFNEHPKEE